MKISRLLQQNTLSISFEVFPPKTETAFESVKTATEEIARLGPAFMSVTYGAGGGTSKYTLDIAENIRETYGVPTLAHLTCVSSTRETVKERIADIKAAGIENVMALRGDIPRELENADRSGWAYHHAVELVLTMAKCTECYARLPLVQDKDILDNVLYSGVWCHCKAGKKEVESQ